MPLRPVLMIAYYFPPAGGAGVQRTLKFTRYLPDHGWQPHLVVPENADYPALDPSLEREVPPAAVVHRTRIVEPYEMYRRMTGRAGERSLDVVSMNPASTRSRGERFAEWVRGTVFVPDARIGWYPFATRVARRVAREVRPPLIYSSAPPYTTHLVGRAVHRATGLPWVADFRDSWVDWLSAPKRTGLSRRIEGRMEGSVLREATRVITVSRGVADDLASRHPGARDDRWLVLPNGFDPEDLDAAAPDRDGIPADELLISYAGTLYGPRSPETLVRAIETLATSGGTSRPPIRVRFVGRVAEPFVRRMEESPARDCFSFVPYVEHARATALSLGADVLLLVVDDVPQAAGILTGKLFEYLGMRKPILLLGPDGEAAALVREANAGLTVGVGDVPGMVAALHTLLAAHRGQGLEGPSEEDVRPYERRTLTGALAAIFRELADGSGVSGR